MHKQPSYWLIAAGIYNILWGGAMGLAPVATLGLFGIHPASRELWPQFWACIGMIIGVYGIGYLIAAGDPERHWPIVLVGLLGKILGPIGFLNGAIHHEIPWSLGANLLTNDLLWWIPFSLLLLRAARAARQAVPSSCEQGA
jgi:hypothetical protein